MECPTASLTPASNLPLIVDIGKSTDRDPRIPKSDIDVPLLRNTRFCLIIIIDDCLLIIDEMGYLIKCLGLVPVDFIPSRTVQGFASPHISLSVPTGDLANIVQVKASC